MYKVMQFRRHSMISLCRPASKKLSTLSLYRWFMDAFMFDMPEIGSSSLSGDRRDGEQTVTEMQRADCSPAGITRRSDLAVSWEMGIPIITMSS